MLPLLWLTVYIDSPSGIERKIFRENAVHDDVIKWKHFPRNWPFVRGIHRSPVNSPHKGQWRGALMFSLICVWINDWVNNREAGDLRRYRAHYDVIVMTTKTADAMAPTRSSAAMVMTTYIKQVLLPRGMSSITCATSRSKNDGKGKYIFMFPSLGQHDNSPRLIDTQLHQ